MAHDSTPQLPFGFADDEPLADRPVIRVTNELHDTITASIAALSEDRNLFSRAHELVEIIRVTREDADGYLPVGAPKIRPVPAATMRERLTRAAVFEERDGRKKNGWKLSIPHDNVVTGVLARAQYPGIRPIVGVLEAPSLRPDGTIIQAPGYDARTGYLYEPAIAFPDIPESPTQLDACKALRDLLEVFHDFPFVLPAGRSACVATLLSLMARPAIKGCIPALIVDANVKGAGKSRVTDTIGIIATGRETAKMNWPSDDIELEKMIGSYALRGTPIVNFDNINRPFGGAPLERCLTAADTIEIRVLGKSETPELMWRAQVMGTGNNIAVGGDMARRALVARMESPLERPEDRTDFLHPDLIQWVKQERPRLVVAALTLLRAFFVAGCPKQEGARRWGSFEAWSDLIPQAIVFAGGVDPMGARPADTGQEEPERLALVGLLEGLAQVCADQAVEAVSVSKLLATLYPPGRRGDGPPDGYDGLRDSVEALVYVKPGSTPGGKQLAGAFRRHKHRVVGGKSLTCMSARAGVVAWKVR